MKRVLLTGMSGTGKSTLIGELRAGGYKAIDTDEPGWSEYGPAGDWRWREDVIQDLLCIEAGDVLFLSGCVENQVKFYPQFDHIVLLSAPAEIILDRLATRTNNPYGKRPEEVVEVLGYLETVEPLLRRGAGHEIDTSAPLIIRDERSGLPLIQCGHHASPGQELTPERVAALFLEQEVTWHNEAGRH